MNKDKYSLLFPEYGVYQNFLNFNELNELRELFHRRKNEFCYGKNEDGTLSSVCRPHQLIDATSQVQWIREKFKTAYQKHCPHPTLENKLNFETIYFKYYLDEDSYGMHVDNSPCNLTFLLQLTSDESKVDFPDLVFHSGKTIPYESNQLLIFHSDLAHSFTNRKGHKSHGVYKYLVQCLPKFSNEDV